MFPAKYEHCIVEFFNNAMRAAMLLKYANKAISYNEVSISLNIDSIYAEYLLIYLTHRGYAKYNEQANNYIWVSK